VSFDDHRLVRHGLQLRSAQQPWCNLSQRHQNESALVHARVRHRQTGGLDASCPIEQQIQVERSRRVPVGPLAARALFDGLHGIQQRGRAECGGDFSDRIDVVGTAGVQGCRAIKTGGFDHPYARRGAERCQGVAQSLRRLTEVGAERDKGRDFGARHGASVDGARLAGTAIATSSARRLAAATAAFVRRCRSFGGW